MSDSVLSAEDVKNRDQKGSDIVELIIILAGGSSGCTDDFHQSKTIT